MLVETFGNTAVVRLCAFPDCKATQQLVMDGMTATWGGLVGLAAPGNGWLYYGTGNGQVRKHSDDGSQTNAQSFSTLLHTGSVVSNFTKLDGHVYWVDSSRNLVMLNTDDDSVTTLSCISVPGAAAVRLSHATCLCVAHRRI